MSRVSAFRRRVLLRAFWRLTRLLGDIGGGASKMPGALDRTLRPVACGAVSVPLDFRSAGYLGFRYPSDRLPPWNVLTTGRPDALGVHPAASAVERGLADLMGCESAVLAPSTLHLFTDLFGHLKTRHTAIYVDAGAYPVARWCLERAAIRGVPVAVFRHFDPDDLRRCLGKTDPGRRPLVVTDGLDMDKGEVAPLGRYLRVLAPLDGRLVLDDTQALGLLGERDFGDGPYGRGGGGSLRWHGIGGDRVLAVASLAKSFGVPVAVLGGGRETVRDFRRLAGTRMHSSPPSVPILLAALYALLENRARGDRQRRRLALRIQRLRRGLARLGLGSRGGPLPVQGLHGLADGLALPVHRRLLEAGISTLLRQPDPHAPPELAVAVTAGHTPVDVDRLLQALKHAVPPARREAVAATVSGSQSPRQDPALQTRSAPS